MQQLHLVGFTADLEGLIFSAKKGARSGAYVVAMDDSLLAALEEARKLVSAAAGADDGMRGGRSKQLPALGRTGRTSSLSVREVQSRLRAGSSLAEIADAAGVDEGWVARFAAPVLAEQADVVNRTLPLVFETSRKGPSSRPLGESVRWNLVDRGIVIDDTSFDTYWSAYQVTPRQWAVRFTYLSRGRSQVAEWEVDPETGQLTARNRLASDLAHVEAGARRRRVPPAVEANGAAGVSTTGRGGASRKASSSKRAQQKKAAPKAPARKAGVRKPSPAAKKTAAAKTAAKKTAAKKTAAKKTVPARRPAVSKAVPAAAPTVQSDSPAPAPPRPGTRGVTAAQAASAPLGARRTIGTPGLVNRSAAPYRPTIVPRPVPPRPAPAEPAPEPVTAPPTPALPVRNVVPAIVVPPRPAPVPTAPVRPVGEGSVRRVPAPSAAAVAMRGQVRPAPGSDSASPPSGPADRPSILVINAEQAGRRRPRS